MAPSLLGVGGDGILKEELISSNALLVVLTTVWFVLLMEFLFILFIEIVVF